MSKVEEAKIRASKNPDDVTGWIHLVQTMDAEVRSLDPQKVWEAAVDRWTALDRIAELAPSEEWMTTRAEHFGWMASVCARSGRPELAAELGLRELAALRALLPHSGDLEAVANKMVPRAQKLAEAAEVAEAAPQAAAALEHMLLALYVLAEARICSSIGGRPRSCLDLRPGSGGGDRTSGAGPAAHRASGRGRPPPSSAGGHQEGCQGEAG